MFDFRTDMADERRDIFRTANKLEDEVPGIKVEEYDKGKDIKVFKVNIVEEQGAKAIGKPIGTYVTIDIKNLKIASDEEIARASDIITTELKQLLDKHIKPNDCILVVGLGNVYVTPDSLGPKVVSEIDITRHLLHYVPHALSKDTRPVSAIAPGVLGTTGIETLEIVKGVVENVKPKAIIVIDSLASKSIGRISSTVQIADTGIVPGAGVGNKRSELSMDTLGIPVIAIGVPMVVEAATIISDGLDIFATKIKDGLERDTSSGLYELVEKLKGEDKYEMIRDVLVPENYNLIVTPKEVDDLIENMKDVVARGINYAL